LIQIKLEFTFKLSHIRAAGFGIITGLKKLYDSFLYQRAFEVKHFLISFINKYEVKVPLETKRDSIVR